MLKRFVLAFALFIFMASPVSAQNQSVGELGEYVTLPKQTKVYNSQNIEAVLFFWYGCGGCFKVDKALNDRESQWPDNVTFIRMPSMANPMWKFHGQIYLALEEMGAGQDTHLAVFDAFQNKRIRVTDREDLPVLMKAIGINYDDFIQAFDSTDVAIKMEKVSMLTSNYDVRLVPSMVIDGKYRFDLGMVKGVEGFMNMADYLIDKQRAAGK